MAQILKTFREKEGFVRSVHLLIGKKSSTSKDILFEQPVNKFELFVENKHN